MIKFRNTIKMTVMAAILPFILFSCIGEEMMPCGKLIVVQRIGEGGNAGTRGTVISSNTDLKGETFGFDACLIHSGTILQCKCRGESRPHGNHIARTILAGTAGCQYEVFLVVSLQWNRCTHCELLQSWANGAELYGKHRCRQPC